MRGAPVGESLVLPLLLAVAVAGCGSRFTPGEVFRRVFQREVPEGVVVHHAALETGAGESEIGWEWSWYLELTPVASMEEWLPAALGLRRSERPARYFDPVYRHYTWHGTVPRWFIPTPDRCEVWAAPGERAVLFKDSAKGRWFVVKSGEDHDGGVRWDERLAPPGAWSR